MLSLLAFFWFYSKAKRHGIGLLASLFFTELFFTLPFQVTMASISNFSPAPLTEFSEPSGFISGMFMGIISIRFGYKAIVDNKLKVFNFMPIDPKDDFGFFLILLILVNLQIINYFVFT